MTDKPQGRILYRGEYDYPTLDGTSITLLKEMLKSPKHYRYRQKFSRFASPSMSKGTTTHIAVLEPERFLKEYAIWDSKDEEGKTKQRRGKVWEAFQEQHSGKTIVKSDEYDEAIAIRDAVRKDTVAMKYLAMGDPEVALSWNDEHTGMLCRGRADWLATVDHELCIVDLKTTRDASPLWFSRDCAKYSYHLQLAYYADAIERATGKAPKTVVVAVESMAPYDVVTYLVPEDVLDIGREAYRTLLERLKWCQERNEWPGQGEMMERYLTLPSWCIPEEDGVEGLELDWSKEE